MRYFLPEVCADVLLHHGIERRPKVVEPPVKGVHTMTHHMTAKRTPRGWFRVPRGRGVFDWFLRPLSLALIAGNAPMGEG